jgi:Domain of unknown function (DUF4430)
VRRLALVALLAVALGLAGCGSGPGAADQATVWVTRDRGAHVLHAAKVPASGSALQALQRVAKVKTRFGGRYVREVDGVAERGRRAWFYYANGYLADRGAGDYRLRAGDVIWWDYRSWRDPLDDAVVVGAFPEPFLHGYAGKRLPSAVLYREPRLRRGALALGRLLGAVLVAPIWRIPPQNANLLVLEPGPRTSLQVLEGTAATKPGSPVFFRYSGDPLRLARNPRMFRYRYSVP